MLLATQGQSGGADTLIQAFCSASDVADDLVYVFGPDVSGKLTVRKVDITDSSKMPAIGVIISKSSSTDCVVRLSGEITQTGIPAGSTVFASLLGTMQAGPPGPPPSNVSFRTYQIVGSALKTDTVSFHPEPSMVRIREAS